MRRTVVLALLLVGLVAAAGGDKASAAVHLDRSYGSGGQVVLPIAEPGEEARIPVALQRDGSLLINSGGALERLDSSGHPDPSFGEDGIVTPPAVTGGDFSIRDATLDAQGRIVVVGISSPPQPGTRPILHLPYVQGPVYEQAAAAARILRYLPNGQLDPSFGEGGIVETDFGLPPPKEQGVALAAKPVVYPSSVAVDASGLIVITGSAVAGVRPGGCFHDDWVPITTTAAFVARLTEHGGLDPGFGRRGVFGGRSVSENPLSMEAAAEPIPTSSGGVVFLRGYGNCAAAQGAPGFIQLTSSGTLFNSSKRRASRSVVSAAIAPDGSVVLLEHSNRLADRPLPQRITRLRPNGTLDRSFGRTGRVALDLPDEGEVVSIAVDTSGRILLAGTKYPSSRLRPSVASQIPRRALLMRLHPGGGPERGFGKNGVVTTTIPRLARVEHLWLDQAGRPTVTGAVGPPNGPSNGLIAFRYALS